MGYLPTILRPRGVPHKELTPGLDLPSFFCDELKAIDPKLFIVYHPYRVMWEGVINEYVGELEDPRFTIHREFGQENWGFVLTDGDGFPIEEAAWHIWRLEDPHGWAHVVKIESHEGEYLSFLLNRLNLQAIWTNRYGASSWGRKLDSDAEEIRESKKKMEAAMHDAYQEENSWLMKRAMENFERGVVAPTNPTTSQIISYPGQTNRTATERLITDEEGGLVVPER